MRSHGNILRAAESADTTLAHKVQNLQSQMDVYGGLLRAVENAVALRAESKENLRGLLQTQGDMLKDFNQLRIGYISDSVITSRENDETLDLLSFKAEQCLTVQKDTLNRIEQGLTFLSTIAIPCTR